MLTDVSRPHPRAGTPFPRWLVVASAFLLAAAAFTLFAPEARAQDPNPNGFTQQGFVTDSNGNPLDGNFQMTFILSRSSNPAQPTLYEETLSVPVSNGQYTARSRSTGTADSRTCRTRISTERTPSRIRRRTALRQQRRQLRSR